MHVKTNQRILWFHRKSMSAAQKGMLTPFLNKRGINHASVMFVCLEQKFPKYRTWKGKNKWVLDESQANAVKWQIAEWIKNTSPGAIVINDEIALSTLVGQRSLDTCRGSVYHINKIPAIVIDDVIKVHRVKEFSWIFQSDLARLKRYLDGKQRIDPAFVYEVCTSVSQLDKFRDSLGNGLCLANDIETGKDIITSISYTCIYHDGSINTIVVPFVDPTKVDGCYWDDEEDEIKIWEIVRKINTHPIFKIFQNGLYDAAWECRFRAPPENYLFDTMHAFHSIFCEAPQSLDYITSYFIDTYRYWKDEIKGNEEKDESGTKIPKTKDGLEMFWRYNGLDSYYTLLDFLYLAKVLTLPGMEWAKTNYNIEIRMQLGPCFAMTMRGMKANKERQLLKHEEWLNKACKALDDLRVIADDPEFNPNSSQQFAVLLYDVLGAKPVQMRGKAGNKGNARSTDEKMLKFVALQHPLFDYVINKLWEMKKPLNLISNYGTLETFNDRWLYNLSMRTETGRMLSNNHPYWYGRNEQNWPDEIRELQIADEGWVIFDADYSQSDSYFIAVYSKDEQMIKNVIEDPRDTHCIHAEFFFKEPYEKVYNSYKKKEAWAVHSTKGVRQNSKRINHGANYRMRGGTLYIVMGHEALVETARAMGEPDVDKWSMNKCREFAQALLDMYANKLYPRLPKWYKESVDEAVRNQNKVTVYGGRTRLFFGNIRNDDGIQRELSAYYGQGGTAGNINRAMDRIFYSELEVGSGFEKHVKDIRLHVQAHDAIVGMVRPNRFDLLDKLLTIMREPVTIGEKTFLIPVECEVGLSWGKNGLIKYTPGKTTMADIEANERKLNDKYRKLSQSVVA